MELSAKIVEWFRKERTKYLEPLGKFLVKLKIKAIYLTILAFVFGLAAVYFFWQEEHFYFVLFGALHLLVDALDGLVARVDHSVTRLGAHLDNASDRLILMLILIMSFFKSNDYFILIVLGLNVLHHFIFVLSDLKGKVAYSRLAAMILFFLQLDLAAYFLIGALSLYGLSLQFNDFLKKKFTT